MEQGFNRATLRGVIVEEPQMKKGCVFFTLAWFNGTKTKLNYVKCAVFGDKAIQFHKMVNRNASMVVDGYLDTLIFTSYVGVRVIVNSWFLQSKNSENNSYISQMYEDSVTHKLKVSDLSDGFNI